MRNMLAFLAAAVLVVAGLGWYLGWYTVDLASSSAGKHNISIDINGKKITEDVGTGVKKGERKLHDWLDQDPGLTPTKAEAVRDELALPHE